MIPAETVVLRHQGTARSFLLWLPDSVSPAKPLSLVIGLHGRGMNAAALDRLTGFSELAADRGFALAMPNAMAPGVSGVEAKRQRWNDGRKVDVPLDQGPDDVGFLSAVIDHVARRTPIDRRAVFLFGISNGANMTARYACSPAADIAGFAQVAGTAAALIARECHPPVPIPVLSIHGTADQAAPYGGGNRRGLRMRFVLPIQDRPAIGVEDWLRLWAARNGASGPLATRLPPDTLIRAWHGPTPRSDVLAYRVDGGGHTWPGGSYLPRILLGRTTRTFSATRVIWDFFAAHSA